MTSNRARGREDRQSKGPAGRAGYGYEYIEPGAGGTPICRHNIQPSIIPDSGTPGTSSNSWPPSGFSHILNPMHPRTISIIRRSLIGLVIAVLMAVIFNYAQVWYRRARLVKKAVEILGPGTLRSFNGFEYSSTPNGKLRFRITAKRLVDTQSGKSLIEGIEAQDFYPDGSVRYEIHSSEAVFDRENNRADFSGNVRIFLAGLYELRTNSLRYDLDARRGESAERIQFISETASGSAGGAFFDQGQKTLELKSGVDFVLNAGGGETGGSTQPRQFHGVADHAIYAEDKNRIVFENRARIDSKPDELSADRIEAVLSPDRKRVVSLQSFGKAAYSSKMAGSSQFIRGDRIEFTIGRFQSLERVTVTGQAQFSSESFLETQTLNGNEIDLFLDAVLAKPSKIEGRGQVFFQRRGTKEQISVSGSEFAADFSPASSNLQGVTVRGRAAMSIDDAENSTRNELKSDEIILSFRDRNGETGFERLRASGSALWTYEARTKREGTGGEPARTLESSSLEMIFSQEGNSFESGSASGNVVISEKESGADGESRLSRLSADFARFHFFPANNRIRNMSARGHVQASYEKAGNPERSAAEKFNAKSENMDVVFSLNRGESAVESAAQWGRFVYSGASMNATAGRCEYDARSGILTLKESPRISDAISSNSGERMEYELGTKIVSVYGQVKSRLNARSGKSRFMAFSSSSAIITADAMRYWTVERRALYSGKVRVLSETGQLQAGRLDIIEGGSRVEARDSVRHHIPQTEISKTAVQGDKVLERQNDSDAGMTIWSSSLKYDDLKNAITYAGGIKARSGEMSLSSDTLVAELAETGGGIERVTASGGVLIRQNEREGKADVADYFLNPKKFVLKGNPAEISEPGKIRSAAPQLTYIIADDRILLGSQQ